MAAGEGTEQQFKVLLAVDASKQARDAVEYYLKVLYKSNHQLQLIHAVELPDFEHARDAHLTPDKLAELYEKEHKKAAGLEESLKEIFKKYNVPHVAARTEGGGKPGQILVRIAEEEKAHMIVMGTRGLGTIRRTLMGSVSDYVVHHAHCPVVVCRHPWDHETPAQ